MSYNIKQDYDFLLFKINFECISRFNTLKIKNPYLILIKINAKKKSFHG